MAQESSFTPRKTATTGSGEQGAAKRAKRNTAAHSTPAQALPVSQPFALSVLQDDLRTLIDAGFALRVGAVDAGLVVVISSANHTIGWQNDEITLGGVPVTALTLAEFEGGLT